MIIGAFALFPAASHSQLVDPSSLTYMCSSKLACAAWATSINFGRGNEPETADGIPAKYWATQIKALKPIKVYTHRLNIVVVLRLHDNIEEGKYIYIPISSYLPMNGVDGFEYTPNPQRDNKYYAGDDVLDYRRVRSK
jgi:hypothetical protein